jgi:hypothetical protein
MLHPIRNSIHYSSPLQTTRVGSTSISFDITPHIKQSSLDDIYRIASQEDGGEESWGVKKYRYTAFDDTTKETSVHEDLVIRPFQYAHKLIGTWFALINDLLGALGETIPLSTVQLSEFEELLISDIGTFDY